MVRFRLKFLWEAKNFEPVDYFKVYVVALEVCGDASAAARTLHLRFSLGCNVDELIQRPNTLIKILHTLSTWSRFHMVYQLTFWPIFVFL